jgi:hypothetical protein
MRMVFGVLSLLVVLAIVGSLAKKQLQAVSGQTTAIPGAVSGAASADAAPVTVGEQSRNIQQQVRDSTAAALQQGVERNERAAP